MFKSKSAALSVLLLLAILCISFVEAVPQNNGKGKGQGGKNKNKKGGGQGGGGGQGRGGQLSAQAKAEQKPGGISTAKDGTTILDTTATINGLNLRYKISAPLEQFKQASGVQGAGAGANSAGNLGIHVLLHGDGGQSFFAFPNKGVVGDFMGVVVLAPDANLKWGGADKNGQQRPDGAAHAQALVDLIQQELPQMVALDPAKTVFSGVSGGSLLLSGFVMPGHMNKFPNAAVMLNCGAMSPQGKFSQDATAAIAKTRIHFQSTQKELNSLQKTIPQSIKAYIKVASDAGLSDQEINKLQTVDNSPNGGHCAFDGKDFESGVQLMADSFADVMLSGGSGEVKGIGSVLNGVVGNENPKFQPGERK